MSDSPSSQVDQYNTEVNPASPRGLAIPLSSFITPTSLLQAPPYSRHPSFAPHALSQARSPPQPHGRLSLDSSGLPSPPRSMPPGEGEDDNEKDNLPVPNPLYLPSFLRHADALFSRLQRNVPWSDTPSHRVASAPSSLPLLLYRYGAATRDRRPNAAIEAIIWAVEQLHSAPVLDVWCYRFRDGRDWLPWPSPGSRSGSVATGPPRPRRGRLPPLPTMSPHARCRPAITPMATDAGVVTPPSTATSVTRTSGSASANVACGRNSASTHTASATAAASAGDFGPVINPGTSRTGSENVTPRGSIEILAEQGWSRGNAAAAAAATVVAAAASVRSNEQLRQRDRDRARAPGTLSIAMPLSPSPALSPHPSILARAAEMQRSMVFLGATRSLLLRHRQSGAQTVMQISHGDMITWGPDMERMFEHCVRRDGSVDEENISIVLWSGPPGSSEA